MKHGSVLRAAAVAGTLDIAYAFGVHAAAGVAPATILQAIASGILGRAAYTGGAATAAAGLVLHYVLMLAMSYGYAAAASRLRGLAERPVTSGALYGLLLFAVMNYVIVPLSAAVPGTPPEGYRLAGAVLAHVFLVGIPIALITRRGRRRGSSL